MRLTVHPRGLLVVLLPLALLLVLVSLLVEVINLRSAEPPLPGQRYLLAVVRVDAERTVPAWFSSSVLLIAALLLLDVARSAWRAGSTWRWHWAALVLVFAYLSADEGVGLHEHGTLVVEWLGVETALTTSWLLLALPLVGVFVLAMIPLLLALPRVTAVRFVAAGALYVGGAAGLEVVGSVAAEAGGGASMPYLLASHAEELLEKVGVVVFAWAVADHASTQPEPPGRARASDAARSPTTAA